MLPCTTRVSFKPDDKYHLIASVCPYRRKPVSFANPLRASRLFVTVIATHWSPNEDIVCAYLGTVSIDMLAKVMYR